MILLKFQNILEDLKNYNVKHKRCDMTRNNNDIIVSIKSNIGKYLKHGMSRLRFVGTWEINSIFVRSTMLNFGRKHISSVNLHGNHPKDTAQKIWSHLRIWSHLLKKSLMEIFIFCAVGQQKFFSVE